MSTPLTNIRVFVHWAEQTVFAGEDIECRITFKNIAATPPPPSRSTLHPPPANGFATGGLRKAPTAQVKGKASLSPRPAQFSRGHRTTLSLNAPTASVRSQSQAASSTWNGGASRTNKEGNTHKRSVSIISIGASEALTEDVGSQASLPERPSRSSKPSRGHGRSASLQIIPRRHGFNGSGGPTSGESPMNHRSATHPSPLVLSFSSSNAYDIMPEGPTRRQSGVATAPNTPKPNGFQFARRKASPSFSQNFKFPAQSSPNSGDPDTTERPKVPIAQENGRLLSPISRESIPSISEHVAPMTRVLSPASVVGTPRSSGEFYSLSNNSTETLASEYPSQPPSRMPSYVGHTRRPSSLAPASHHRPPEILMMGYAQISGSFTLDGSLISQSPFEEVKRKGAVGGQGGGVIGVETNRRDSGLLRSFAWGSLGDSLGGLLGGSELSSMKDMRGIASSRSIPLLSTPQSILFVDLKLTPGESKTYEYSFKLPRGLPPTHRGKAIKISYKLVIGTQRPGGAKEQQIKSVEIPFRLLGSVNDHGEILGHDLMAPYIILRDQARVKTLEEPLGSRSPSLKSLEVKPASTNAHDSTLDEFLSYVDELLSRPRQTSSLGFLSPTDAVRSRRLSSVELPTTAKQAIDMAILRSNVATESRQSANRFEIARSGKRVAVIMLARPAYRLGETITVVIDFTDTEIPCYAIHASLETSEKIDNAIALRSEASILRVTRKIHSSHSESTLFARRVVFSPTIPVSATPEFITSGVSLEWWVRIEFVTPRLLRDFENTQRYTELLEEVSRDDRGTVFAAAETLDCESFEIAVPLRIYGALTGNTDRDEMDEEGLVV